VPVLALGLLLAACEEDDDDTTVETVSYLYVYVANGVDGTVSAFSVNEDTGSLTEVSGSPYTSTAGINRVAADPEGRFLYVTGSSISAIEVWAIDGGDGTLSEVSGSPFTAEFGPQAIEVHPNGHMLFICKDGPTDQVKGYAVDTDTGELTAAPGSPASTGSDAFEMAISPDGEYLYTANNGSGDLSAFAIVSDTAVLATLPSDPIIPTFGTQPHDLVFDAAGRFLYVADDSFSAVHALSLNTTTGELANLNPSSFATPTANFGVVADPSGQFLYAMDGVDKLNKFKIGSDGSLGSRATYNVGTSDTAMEIDPDGKFLYIMDTGSDVIWVFSVDPDTGALSELTGDDFPVAAGTSPFDVVAVRASE
jgi:6-phosphogluconolactonase (cycloisomerase 2 family)